MLNHANLFGGTYIQQNQQLIQRLISCVNHVWCCPIVILANMGAAILYEGKGGRMTKKVLVPFTTGVEEIELVAIVDVLRRAGVMVCMASLDGLRVVGRSQITLTADVLLADVLEDEWDMVVLPGGLPNAHLLRDEQCLKDLVLNHVAQGKMLAAICAAPTALAAWGLTQNKRVTAHPACADEMILLQASSTYVAHHSVEDGLLLTSQGAGTAVDFALKLVEKLCGLRQSEAIRLSIVA